VIHLTRDGLYVHFLRPTETRRAVGFKIKWGTLLFSEREGQARGFKIGPLYFGTFR
jgi:hypothetical protein